MGQEIQRSVRQESLRWYLPAQHHTGIVWDEQECRQFASLREAREAIREDHRAP